MNKGQTEHALNMAYYQKLNRFEASSLGSEFKATGFACKVEKRCF